jgi:pimeloyl-ACP methyl ester carboxylesterase
MIGRSVVAVACFLPLALARQPASPGRMIEVGSHRLHLYCTGRGTPTVVVETGLGDFSFDWVLVQARVSRFTRICTYDRAGYAWSEPGPMPRTYAQINLELHEALARAGETSPYVVVGQSYGGPVVRSFAARYPNVVAGMVLVDAVQEDQRVIIGKKAVQLRGLATGRPIPEPRLGGGSSPAHESTRRAGEASGALPPLYDRLPKKEQRLHRWAQSLAQLQIAEDSQHEWSPESLALMHSKPQEGILGNMPLVVLSRNPPGYESGLDIPAGDLDREYRAEQDALARLSRNSVHTLVESGHNMHVEAPGAVAEAIREVVVAVRNHSPVK